MRYARREQPSPACYSEERTYRHMRTCGMCEQPVVSQEGLAMYAQATMVPRALTGTAEGEQW